jgi:transcriptional regulator, Crp/Fnr famil
MSVHASEDYHFRDYIDSFDLWHPLTNAQQDVLLRNTRFMRFRKGTSVYRGPLGSAGILHIISGVLRVYILSEEGRAFTLCFLRAGDAALLTAAALFDGNLCDISIEADEDTGLFLSDTVVVRQILGENLHVRVAAYERSMQRLSEILGKFHQALFISADRRLARFLLAESERTGDDEIRLTHEQTAQSLGTAREVVSRLIREFSQEGMVETARGRIHILDRAALQCRADA